MEHYTREEFQELITLTKEHNYWTEEMETAMTTTDNPWVSWIDYRMKTHPKWFAWDVLLAPIDKMPLFINDSQKNLFGSTDILSFTAVIARWRLRVGR